MILKNNNILICYLQAELVGGLGGYWRSNEDDEISNTPDSSCHTLPELFEKAAIRYKDDACLGTREFFREEDEVQPNGKVFKKVTRTLLTLIPHSFWL